MKPIEQYRAVFFDAGDTLLNVPAAQTIVQQFLSERSIRANERELETVLRHSIDSMYYGKERDEAATCSPESDRGFWVALYRLAMERLQLHASLGEAEIHRLCHELYDVFTSPEPYRLFDDVVPVLSGLRTRGLRLSIISNFAPTLERILQVRGLDLDWFDEVVVSTKVGLEKPNPDIFKLALEKTGLSPEDVLYVGDHEVNDVWAPNEIGMDAVRILRYPYQQGDGIRSLSELLAPDIPWIRRGKRER